MCKAPKMPKPQEPIIPTNNRLDEERFRTGVGTSSADPKRRTKLRIDPGMANTANIGATDAAPTASNLN